MLVEQYLQSRNPGPPLRVAVMLDGNRLMKPLAEVLEHIRRSGFARLELLIYHDAPPPPALPRARAARWLKLLLNAKIRRHLLYELYMKLDARRSPAEAELLAEIDISGMLRGIPAIYVRPIAKGFAHRFPEDAVGEIRRREIDVILRYGFNILKGEVLEAARFGVWSYHHGDNDAYRGGPPHFWELAEKHALSGVMLQILTEKLDAGLVLCKGLAATEPGISITRNRVRPYYLGTTFVIRKLHELHERGFDSLRRNSPPAAPYHGQRQIYRRPENAEMARFLAPSLLRLPFRRERVVHWRIAARGSPSEAWRWIEAPRGRFWADPFLIRRDGQTWCFFEDYSYASGRAVISCGVLEGGMGEVRTALDTGHHLSYPQVFEDGGEVYMIPETGAVEEVALFRARRFPGEWVKDAVLLRGRLRDATLLRREGRYWLFVTVYEPPPASGQLLLFHADSLRGPWQYHPASPLSADVRYCRNGGAVLEEAGKLLRVAQDGSRAYGSALHFLEVECLTPGGYRERLVRTLEPDWAPGLAGTHTYNRCGNVEVTDGWRREPASRHLPGG